LVCLKSRRRHVDCNVVKSADDYRCKYYKLMLVPSRILQTSLLSHFVLNAPANKPTSGSPVPSTPSSGYHSLRVYSSDVRSKFDLIAETEELQGPELEEVVAEPHERVAVEESQQLPDPILVASAVQNLLSVLGEMEFEMGVQNILTGNYGVAVEQLKQGAFHHHAGATFNLGLCFEQGLGCVKSMEKAAECYQVAAGLGHKKAMYNLAIFYLHGLGGLEKDRKMARLYFQAAANLGLDEARRALAPKQQPLPEFLKPRSANEHKSLQLT
jgi:Sel1 repeat